MPQNSFCIILKLQTNPHNDLHHLCSLVHQFSSMSHCRSGQWKTEIAIFMNHFPAFMGISNKYRQPPATTYQSRATAECTRVAVSQPDSHPLRNDCGQIKCNRPTNMRHRSLRLIWMHLIRPNLVQCHTSR